MPERQYGRGFSAYCAIVSFPTVSMATNRYPPVANTRKHQGPTPIVKQGYCGTNDANELRRAPDGLAGRHARAWLSRRPSTISRNQAYRKNRPGHGTRFDTFNNAEVKNIHKRGSRQSRLHWPRTPREGERHRYAYSLPYRSIFAFKLFSC